MKTICLLAGVIEESNRRGGSRLGNIEMERITLKSDLRLSIPTSINLAESTINACFDFLFLALGGNYRRKE